MNGEEKTFFTELFAQHAEKLGDLKRGQEEITTDMKEVKSEVKVMKKKLDESCVEKTDVARAINYSITKHYNEYHDPEKILGGAIIRNRERLWKIGFIVISIILGLVGVGSYAGGI